MFVELQLFVLLCSLSLGSYTVLILQANLH